METVVAVVDAVTVRTEGGETLLLDGLEIPRSAADRTVLEERIATLVGKSVQASPTGGKDRYGRVPAGIFDAEGSVQTRIVGDGLARIMPGRGENPCLGAMFAAEAEARRTGRGIWSKPEYRLLNAEDPSLFRQIGLYEIVEGRIRHVGHGSRVVFLDFGDDPQSDFTVLVPLTMAGQLMGAATDLNGLVGRRVRVRGVIEDRGGPAVWLGDPDELEVLGE